MTTAVDNPLATIISKVGIDSAKAQPTIDTLSPFVAEAGDLVRESASIVVTDATQVTEIKAARSMRLKLKDIRVRAEKARKSLKEDALKTGQFIDACANWLKDKIEPEESRLEEQEKFAERKEAERKAAVSCERRGLLVPLGIDPSIYSDLGGMAESQWVSVLSAAQTAYAERIERECKEAEERAKAERVRQQELANARAEADRLRKEAEAREAEAKAERERVEAERRAEREKAEAERKAIEEKARKEREAAEAVARKEREAREALEAKAAAERAAAEKRAKAEAKAAKAAELAPEKIKIRVIAEQVRRLAMPNMTTPEGVSVLADVKAKSESFAKWIDAQAETLA